MARSIFSLHPWVPIVFMYCHWIRHCAMYVLFKSLQWLCGSTYRQSDWSWIMRNFFYKTVLAICCIWCTFQSNQITSSSYTLCCALWLHPIFRALQLGTESVMFLPLSNIYLFNACQCIVFMLCHWIHQWGMYSLSKSLQQACGLL